jgi:hypothetical protein
MCPVRYPDSSCCKHAESETLDLRHAQLSGWLLRRHGCSFISVDFGRHGLGLQHTRIGDSRGVIVVTFEEHRGGFVDASLSRFVCLCRVDRVDVVALEAVRRSSEEGSGGWCFSERCFDLDLSGAVSESERDMNGVTAAQTCFLADAALTLTSCLPPMTPTVLRYS